MSLSSGTLNLKFMQRGAALKAAAVASSSLSPSTPTKANQSNTSSVPITSQNPTPISSNTQTQTLTETPVSTDTKFDDEERWSLPRRSIPQSIEASTSSSKTRISFESSYLPFLSQGEGSIAHENDNESRDSISAGRQGESSRMGGGGRMAFGGFGSREVERNDTREIDGRSEDMNHGEVKTRRERDEPKRKHKPSNEQREQGQDGERQFRRPAGFSPPPPPSHDHTHYHPVATSSSSSSNSKTKSKPPKSKTETEKDNRGSEKFTSTPTSMSAIQSRSQFPSSTTGLNSTNGSTSKQKRNNRPNGTDPTDNNPGPSASDTLRQIAKSKKRNQPDTPAAMTANDDKRTKVVKPTTSTSSVNGGVKLEKENPNRQSNVTTTAMMVVDEGITKLNVKAEDRDRDQRVEVNGSETTMDLDARERSAKAARKAEKRKRAKEKRLSAGGGTGGEEGTL